MATEAILHQRLIFNAPFPVAYAIRQYYENKDADPTTRAWALANQMETLIRWSTAVALACYQADGFFDRDLNKIIDACFFKKLSMGAWVGLLRSILKTYREQGRRFPIQELIRKFMTPSGKPSKAARSMDRFVTIRNKMAHVAVPR